MWQDLSGSTHLPLAVRSSTKWLIRRSVAGYNTTHIMAHHAYSCDKERLGPTDHPHQQSNTKGNSTARSRTGPYSSTSGST